MTVWQECKLANAPLMILDGDRGKNYPAQEEFKSEGYCLFLSTKNVRPDGFELSECQFISRERDELLRKGKLEKYDLVLTTRGTIGNIGFYDDSVGFPNIRINSGMVIIRPQQHKLSPSFNYYLFRKLQNDFHTFVSGSAQPQLPIKDLKEVEVSIPSLPEQKAIAAVLGSLDDKIDLLHRQNKTLEAMAATLFRQWFVEEAQEDWREYSLSDFATHLKGNVVPAKTPEKIFHHYSLPAFDAGMRPTVEAGSEILSNKYAVKPWSILVSKLNPRFPRIWPIGDLTESDAICSTEFQVFTPKSVYLFGYIYFFLRSGDARDELTMAASGTSGSHQRVRPEDILNIKTNLPSMDLAVQYSALVMPNIRKMWANNEQIQLLEKLRDTLLPKLMSGEIRVKYER